jgi:gliding-associated putative ABC transporter substrate-binding component GldG
MHGGKVIWLIDNLYAEMDSLMRTQSDFIAFDRGLNLEDQLFKYGVRINQDLVQDLQSDKVPLVVGNYGNQPQMQLVPWPYFPLLSSYSNHPISKNLDNVLSIFPNSIDTIATPALKKTVLLASSENSRSLRTPAIVSLNSVKTEDDLKTFNKAHIPIAVLIEGKFSSLFANRIAASTADSLSRYNQPFAASSLADNKMIVVSDADLVSNVVTQDEGPLGMGYNQFTGSQYANKDFFINCIEYLVNPSGILEARTKDITLRLLDPKKIEENKAMWQFINIGLPILLMIIFAGIYQAVRRRRFSS